MTEVDDERIFIIHLNNVQYVKVEYHRGENNRNYFNTGKH